MRARRILLAVCIVVLLVLNTLYVDYQFFAVLVLILIIPLLSEIMLIVSRAGLNISVIVDHTEVQYQSNIKLRIDVKNTCYLPISRGGLELSTHYSNSDDKEQCRINADPAQCMQEDVSYETVARHCGLFDVEIQEYSGSDYIGLFLVRKKIQELRRIIVFPDLIKPEEQDKKAHYTRYEDEESVNSYQEQDEMTGLRDYMPSDPMNRIHWKLSLKKDDLIIREYGECIVKQNVIIVDLSLDAQQHFRDHLDLLYQAAYAVGYCYICNGKQSEFMAWNEQNGTMEELIFTDELSLKNALVDLMKLSCTRNAWSRLQNAVEQSDFVIKQNSILLTTQGFLDSRYYVVDVSQEDMKKRITDINAII